MAKNAELAKTRNIGIMAHIDAGKTTTQPSSTRSERSTSAVKSTWPGVSMRLIVQLFQANGMQAL
jgi:hypothetical protein